MMDRADAFHLAELAASSGVPMHPRMYRLMRDALGELTEDEERILGAHRKAREAREARADEDVAAIARRLRGAA